MVNKNVTLWRFSSTKGIKFKVYVYPENGDGCQIAKNEHIFDSLAEATEFIYSYMYDHDEGFSYY